MNRKVGGRSLSRAPFQVLRVRFTKRASLRLSASGRRAGMRGFSGQRACVRDARGAPRLADLVAPAARARRRMAVAAKTRDARNEKAGGRRNASVASRRARRARTRSKCAPSRGCFLCGVTRICVRRASRVRAVPPFARRAVVSSARAQLEHAQISSDGVNNFRPSVQLADVADSPPLRSRFESPFVWRFSLASERRKTKKKLTPDFWIRRAVLVADAHFHDTSRVVTDETVSRCETRKRGTRARAAARVARAYRARAHREHPATSGASSATREPNFVSAAPRSTMADADSPTSSTRSRRRPGSRAPGRRRS